MATLTARQLRSPTATPDNVRLFDFVPLDALLPTCAAVVHHGGAGTTGNAVAYGVPQLEVPGNVWDKAGLADLLAEQGGAMVVDPDEVTPEGLRAGLTRLLEEPSFAAGAEKAMAAPTPHESVPELERVASGPG
ncbi:nucleotide disphospho-sugar-binding domain-containing protein [Actinosynnema sp. NPDC059335]|uniref:nucleotide disphospho-sugar-binding domain-containing protein n=1 Tax=Actinosynnema sp. NPDC059335 TaxID=3346804 RepID=UPI0036719719